MRSNFNCNKCRDKNFVIECACGCKGILTKNIDDWRQPDGLRSRIFLYHHNFKIKTFGENHHSWKGGKSPHSGGYNTLRINGKDYLEHRIIWEKYYNCCLLPKTVIHHKNGIKNDNRIDNLQPLINGSEHIRIHVSNMVKTRIMKVNERIARGEKGHK